MKVYTQRGFTIIELMITVLLVAILLSIGIPSFASIFKQNRLAAQANTILSSVNYARAETINQNQNVVIAPNSAGTNWSGGWSVSVNGTVIRSFDAIENGTLISNRTAITFQSDGTITDTANITLTIRPSDCPAGDPDLRVITINPSGLSRSSPGNC